MLHRSRVILRLDTCNVEVAAGRTRSADGFASLSADSHPRRPPQGLERVRYCRHSDDVSHGCAAAGYELGDPCRLQQELFSSPGKGHVSESEVLYPEVVEGGRALGSSPPQIVEHAPSAELWIDNG